MIEIPFGPGVAAAFLFLIFELVVFPVLIYTTSAVASILIYCHAKKGNEVRIETLKFPYWNGDLLHRQWSHVLLLMLRAALIAIPVYLETGLEARRSLVSSTIRHAFTVAPTENWVLYERNLNVSIGELIQQGRMVYDRCTRIDAEGWRIAPHANVSFLENGRQRVECIPNTEKKVFRPVRNKDSMRNYSKHENDVSVKLSWVEGPVEAFPNDSFSRDDRTKSQRYNNYTGMQYMVTNIELNDESDLECFPSSSLQVPTIPTTFEFTSHLRDTPSFLCQKVTGTIIEYFFGVSEIRALNITSEERTDMLTNRTGSLTVTMRYIETLQFEKDMMIDAAQVANYSPGADDWRVYGSGCDSCTNGSGAAEALHTRMNNLLYTRADNVTLEVSSSQFDVTVISNKLLIIGVVEVGAVLLCGACMYVWLHCYDVQMPNTLNGLSELWAVSSDGAEYMGTRKRRRVVLRRTKRVDSEPHKILEPSVIVPADEEEQDIQVQNCEQETRDERLDTKA